MKGWVRLYPRAWRARYGDEFDQLVADLGRRPGGRAALDIVRGALDAHWREVPGMRNLLTDAALRRGVFDGLVVAGLIALDVFITNVAFPPGPAESDSDLEYIVQNLATFAVIGLLLMAIGARARRRAGGRSAAARAGAAAGVVIAILATATFVVVNNVWFAVVSRQHDKRLAFAASGWTSMRAFLTVRQVESLVVVVPVLALVGGLLGLAGGRLFRRSAPDRAART